MIERFGRVRTTLLVVGLIAAPPVLIAGVARTVAHVRTYADVRCPPDLVMLSANEQRIIHAVRRTTPPDARILVVSDEHSWFLNYYLFPRRLFQHQEEDLTFPELPGDWITSKRVGWVLERRKGRGFRIRRLTDTSP
jgi:hypothetical protein